MSDVLDFADYPMTPVSVMPLHPSVHLRPGDFYSCMNDPLANSPRYDWRCPECVATARMQTVEEWHDWRHKVGSEPITVTLSWLVSRADYWFEARLMDAIKARDELPR